MARTTKKSTKKSTEDPVIPYFGSDEGKGYTVPTDLFTATVHPRLLSQYVRVYRTNQRQGNAAAKDRSLVAGTTKKMYRQKGTGNARHGSAKAPIFVGGGVVGGPTPKTYSLTLNKKQKRHALVGTLSQKLADRSIYVLPDETHTSLQKTKEVAKILQSVAGTSRMTIVVDPVTNAQLVRTTRNIPRVTIVTHQSLNPYTVLDSAYLVFTPDALSKLIDRYTSPHVA